jgi:predicted Fe-Mo cluster-binding NifX family protein
VHYKKATIKKTTKLNIYYNLKIMKIAVPVSGNQQIDDHFGHCEYYSIFTITENEIADIQTLKSEKGCGCKSNISVVLSTMGVELMLAGGIGAGAINVLNNAGIAVVRGCSGKAEDVVKGYLAGLVIDNGEVCAHHEHHQGQGGNHQCSH